MKDQWDKLQTKDEKGNLIPWTKAPDNYVRYSMNNPPITSGIDGCEFLIVATILHGNIKTIELGLRSMLQLINKKSDWYDTLHKSLEQSNGYQVYGRIHASGQLLYELVHQLSALFLVFFLIYIIDLPNVVF